MPVGEKKSGESKTILRLKRIGPRGEGGLASYHYDGRLYKRAGLYAIDSQKARVLISTGHFERIHPDDLAAAKKDARAPRGMSVNDRQRQKRREAMMKRRRQVVVDDVEEVDNDEALGGVEDEDDVEAGLSV